MTENMTSNQGAWHTQQQHAINVNHRTKRGINHKNN